ncbi:MAG: Peptidase [Candidatus Saccharibacteria bacterium]|nr:Peptidase [Candidatus Saccharibacteria bacterium]
MSIGGGNKAPILEEAVQRHEVQKVLIVPSACSTPQSYARKVPATMQLFSEQLGVPEVSILHHFNQAPTPTQIEHEIATSGLIYVIGGHTPTLLKNIAAHGTGQAIRRATKDNQVVLAGASAGAVLPFQKAMINPATQPAKQAWEYQFVDGLALIPAAATAHANQQDPHPDNGPNKLARGNWFFQNLGELALPGIAIDNHAALVIDGHTATISRSDPDAQIHLWNPANVENNPLTLADPENLLAFWQSLPLK